jgi:hydrophobe/amphiphile efflux-1 (HAE1) family protein
MNMNISAWAIRKPVPSIVLFAVLLLLGIMSFRSLPVTRFPNIDVPVISVTITQSGAAPAELETQVTKQVEDALANITGVKKLISTLADGSSTTAIEFRLEINQDRALNDVRDAIAKIRTDLPRNIDEPIIQRIDVEGQSILSYAASAPGLTIEQLSWYVDDVLKRELQGLKGIGRIARQGGVVREIQILLDPDRLLALGITASAVNAQVRATNVDLGGGRGEIGGQEQTIRTLAGAREVERLAETKIVISGGREVRLGDIARIVDGYSEPRSFADLDGQPVVTFAIFRAKGASEVDVANAVEKRIKALQAARPDIVLTKVDDAVAYTRGNYESAMISLLEGAALAVLVVFLFLRDIRATVIAAIALPLAAIPTFWAMSAMGFSLNLVSLLAITLVTGVLVDDAIVEIENIVRHMRMGKSPYRASIEAADEIGLAVIAITLTIVAIFAPVSFMGGIAGQYFKQFGLVVAAAVLFSLLVARLITPMMAAYLMRPIAHHDDGNGPIIRAYTSVLKATLRNRLTRFGTLLAGVGIFMASIYATAMLPTGFMPDEDNARIVVSTELPPGSTLADVRAATDKVSRTIRELPEVANVLTLGGTSPLGALELRRATLIVQLVPKSKRKLRQKQLKQIISAKLSEIPDTRSWYVNERGEREMSFSVLAADGEALASFIGKLEGELRREPGLKNVASVGAIDRPEIRIVPRYDDAAAVGVTPEAIADTVRVATLGDVAANLAKFNAGDRLVPIRVQLVETARTDLQQIEQLRVLSQSGKAVPLKAVADVEMGRGPASIDRFSRVRRAVVGADLAPGLALGDARDKFEAAVKRIGLPPGVRLEASGDAEIQDEVANGFLTAMGTGLLIVLGVLILLFGSVFQPITILLSLPLSFGGVVLALLVTNNPVSMPVYIGLLMLMGIVTKNAILLVDFAVEEIARGTDRITALIEAGRKRARPIVMTTIAMVAGMIPAALAIGDGGEFRAPMAIAVIGGLLVSTVLSLVFVPSFFTVMDDLGWVVGRIFSPLIGPTDEPDAPAVAGHSGKTVGGHSAPAGATGPERPADTPKPVPLAAE